MASHLEISTQDREGITILDLKGRLVAGDGATALRESVVPLVSEGKTKIIANLRDVDYIDSTGLGSLVICYTTLQKNGGSLKLANLNRRNIELMLLTKLSTVLEIFNNEQDAVNSFFPEREIKRFDILSFVQEQKEK